MMNNSVYDCLIEKNRKILRILYPAYFLLIILLAGTILIKNIVAIILMGIVFLIYSIFFFKFLFRMSKLNRNQIQDNQRIGKEKYINSFKPK